MINFSTNLVLKFKLDFKTAKTIKELKDFKVYFTNPEQFEEFVQLFQECRYANRGDIRKLSYFVKNLTRVDR